MEALRSFIFTPPPPRRLGKYRSTRTRRRPSRAGIASGMCHPRRIRGGAKFEAGHSPFGLGTHLERRAIRLAGRATRLSRRATHAEIWKARLSTRAPQPKGYPLALKGRGHEPGGAPAELGALHGLPFRVRMVE